MRKDNSLTAVISYPVFNLLTDKYGFEFVPCEDMPNCHRGREFHLVPPLGALVNELDDVKAAEFQIEELTEERKKEEAIEVLQILEARGRIEYARYLAVRGLSPSPLEILYRRVLRKLGIGN